MQRGWKGAALALVAAAALAGSAFAQRGGFGFGRMGGGATLLRIPEVQTELKLTDEQKTKVDSMLEQLQTERQGQGQQLRDLSQEERQKRMAERRARDESLVSAILNADQMKRYHELQLQQQGLTALGDKPVADQLKLSDEQRGKVQAAVQAQNDAMRDMVQGGNFDPATARPKMEALRKDTDDKIMAALTDAQKAQWKEMLGATFTFPAPRSRQR